MARAMIHDGKIHGARSRRVARHRLLAAVASIEAIVGCLLAHQDVEEVGACTGRAHRCAPAGEARGELSPVALKRARTARALGSSALARSHSREPRAAVGRGKLDGLKSIISIGSKNPELYYSTLYGKEMAREAVNTRSNLGTLSKY